MKEQTNYRLDAMAKQKAYAVFSQIGIRPTDAVNMFMQHVASFGELPFTPRIPNKKTQQAILEARDPENSKRYTLEEFKKSLGKIDA